MEINGSFSVKVKEAKQVEHKKSDGQQVQVDCEMTITPEGAEQLFGEAFHHVAFACMRNRVEPHDDGDVTVTQFGYETKKPPTWLKASVHNINLWGVKDKGQPQILNLQAGDNLQQVVVKLRFLVDGNSDVERIGTLGAKVGHVAKVTLKPVKAAAFPARAPKKNVPKQKRKTATNGNEATLSVVQ